MNTLNSWRIALAVVLPSLVACVPQDEPPSTEPHAVEGLSVSEACELLLADRVKKAIDGFTRFHSVGVTCTAGSAGSSAPGHVLIRISPLDLANAMTAAPHMHDTFASGARSAAELVLVTKGWTQMFGASPEIEIIGYPK